MLKTLRRVLKSNKGQGIVEYGILVRGVALVRAGGRLDAGAHNDRPRRHRGGRVTGCPR